MAKKKKFPWQQNLLKVSGVLRLKIHDIQGEDIIVAAVKKIPATDIEGGTYRHLGIKMGEAGPEFPERVTPSPDTGRWSLINVEGKDFPRKDLPKYNKTFAVESPNWGDSSSGYHTVYFDRMVYPRDLVPPKYLDIVIEIIEEETTAQGQAYVFRFLVDEVLNKAADGFKEELLYNLNVLQENIGAADVFASDAPLHEYLETVQIDWEILPVGERDDNLRRILTGIRSREIKDNVRERYDTLEELQPIEIIRGTSGFKRYFGAKFADDLVAFENLEYGNALYVMFEDWETLSRKTRLELLAGNREGFERIIHSSGWKTTLRHVIEERRNRP